MPTITLQPDPPVHGQSILICLEDATMPAKITITPAGGTPVTLTLTKFCDYFAVPDGWKGLSVNFHDESGQANDETRTCA